MQLYLLATAGNYELHLLTLATDSALRNFNVDKVSGMMHQGLRWIGKCSSEKTFVIPTQCKARAALLTKEQVVGPDRNAAHLCAFVFSHNIKQPCLQTSRSIQGLPGSYPQLISGSVGITSNHLFLECSLTHATKHLRTLQKVIFNYEKRHWLIHKWKTCLCTKINT